MLKLISCREKTKINSTSHHWFSFIWKGRKVQRHNINLRIEWAHRNDGHYFICYVRMFKAKPAIIDCSFTRNRHSGWIIRIFVDIMYRFQYLQRQKKYFPFPVYLKKFLSHSIIFIYFVSFKVIVKSTCLFNILIAFQFIQICLW